MELDKPKPNYIYEHKVWPSRWHPIRRWRRKRMTERQLEAYQEEVLKLIKDNE